MNQKISTSESRDERLMKAFRYVANEMSADESDSFELAMLEDQALCDAVVQATTLTTALATSAGRPQTTTVRPAVVASKAADVRSSNRSMAAIATGIAVCCCLGLLVSISQPQPDSEIAIYTEQEDAELLVGVWTDEAMADSVIEVEDSEIVADELDVPDWLLAAVTMSDLEGTGSDLSADEFLTDDIEL